MKTVLRDRYRVRRSTKGVAMRKNSLAGRPEERGRRGSAFILTLWIILILSFFAISVSGYVRQKALVYQKLKARETLRRIQESAAKKKIVDIDRLEGNRLLTGISALGQPETLKFGRDQVSVLATDEGGKINLNTAEAYVLINLLKIAGRLDPAQAKRTAYAIIDYRDPDDFVSEFYDRGSERDMYQSAGLAFRPKNAPLEFIGELMLVKGMTKEIYHRLRGYITIYGDGGVNINTAEGPVLESLDISEPLARKIIAVREGRTIRSKERFVFADADRIRDRLSDFFPLSPQEETQLDHAVRVGRMGVQPGSFVIRATGQTASPRAMGSLTCIYGKKEGVQAWCEN